ncbi:hypothetical protein [Tenacibaculum finnmarkense]|uniref:hypothetical protein n=1 Tax=Tenacibaculum finnmarkense TaxID=2781243 RepID=UPI003BB7D97E
MKDISLILEKIIYPKDQSKVLDSDYVKEWLDQNWNLYINIADNNSCTYRQSSFPCFCCIRKDDCLFCEVYKDLSIIDNYYSLNNNCLIQLDIYKTIRTDNSKVQVWLKQNLNLGLKILNDFSDNNYIRRSFINGKNIKNNEFDYVMIYVSLNKFKHNLQFKKLFNHLFFEQKLLENEYVDYIKQTEQIETN